MQDKKYILIVIVILFTSYAFGNIFSLEYSGWVTSQQYWEKVSKYKKFYKEIKFFSTWNINNGIVRKTWGIIPPSENPGKVKYIPCVKLNSRELNSLTKNQIRNLVKELTSKLQLKNCEIIELDIEREQGSKGGLDIKKCLSLIEELKLVNTIKVNFVVEPALIYEWSETDWAAIDKHINNYILMLYDYGKNQGKSQNPAPYKLVEEDIKMFLTRINKPKKINLGVPVYGFLWEEADDNSKYLGSLWLDTPLRNYFVPKYSISEYILSWEEKNDILSNRFLVETERNLVCWDKELKCFYFDIHRQEKCFKVYYEDVCSYLYKFTLANKYELNGICFWMLGREDILLYELISFRELPAILSKPKIRRMILFQYFHNKSIPKLNGKPILKSKIQIEENEQSIFTWKEKSIVF
ncbi:hypothetical protein KAU33_11180 [Candidatus Dependentiae bacterium]|nr:hypothetical protein [Candidatus Dependentiae bacterium]